MKKLINITMWSIIGSLVLLVVVDMVKRNTNSPETTTQEIINNVDRHQQAERIDNLKAQGLTPVYVVNQ